MWMRFVGFWVLVSFILLIVFSCIVGRPVLQLYFRRCCEEDIENDHVIFENLGNNFLRERLISSPDMLLVNEDNYLIADLVKEPIDDKKYDKLFEVEATSKPVFINVHDITSRNKDDGSQTQKESYESSISYEETDDTVSVHIKNDGDTKPYRLQTELMNDYDEQPDEIDKDPKEDGNQILIYITPKKDDSSKKNIDLAEPEIGQIELASSEKNNVNTNEDEENNVEDNEVLLSSEMSTEGKNIKATTVIR